MSYKYPVSKPSLKGNEKKYLNEAIKTGWISSQGPFISQLEEGFSIKHNALYGAACSSGTNALVIALRALGVKAGDEVIVPEFTMIATAWAVSMTGARPVFVDCGEDFLINPRKIEEKITERTKAIIPVHIYGRVCDMEAINTLAREYGLRVVEDSAEAIGVPLSGDIACYSLFANKIISSGEGGICITNDAYLDGQMKHLRAMAFNADHTFLHRKMAYNFRMTNLQAAVALAQLEQLDKFLAKRKQIEAWYDEGLRGIPRIRVLPKRDVLWMYDLLVPYRTRDELQEVLKSHGIETRVFFKPMSQQPMYRDEYENLLAYKASLEGLYLPTYVDLTHEDVRKICKVIKTFYKQKDEQFRREQAAPTGVI